MSTSRSDGGTLGAGLEKRINEMPTPNGGQEPMKRRRRRKQESKSAAGMHVVLPGTVVEGDRAVPMPGGRKGREVDDLGQMPS